MLGIFISERDQEMIEENILPLLDKAKNILDLWKMRGLSILGSVLIFNSLIASLFVYRLTILRKLNKTLINKYDTLARNFIWTGKLLLPLKLIQGNKADGGLGLVNLHNKDRALKIQWVFRIQQNPMIKALAYELMDNPIGDLIWEATLDKADIKYFCTKENFWTDVLEVWGELNCYMPKNAQQVKNQMIWMNSNIRINDKPVVYGKWINSGIIKIKDILTESNSFLSIKQLQDKFGKDLNYLDFLSIVHTIPNTWKRWLKDKNEGNGKRNWYQVLDSNQKHTQCIYQELNKDHSLLNEKVILWNMTFWQEINRDYLLTCINRICTITNVSKLRSFQYRILTQSLITNVQLKQYGIKDSNLCTFCNSQKESTVHLLFYCPSVFNLWNRIYENFKEANI